ncbi:hypothetical protein IC611_09330 [Proteus mirabilis]
MMIKTSLALIPIDAHWWTAQSGALGTTFTFWDKEAKQFYKRHKLALINLIPYLIAIVFGIVYRYGNKLQISSCADLSYYKRLVFLMKGN